MGSTSSEKGQPEAPEGGMANVDRARPRAVPVIRPRGEGGGHPLWIVLLLLAVVALILTAIFGHYALGPRDTIKGVDYSGAGAKERQ